MPMNSSTGSSKSGHLSASGPSPRFIPCPMCSKTILYYNIDSHVDKCLKANEQEKRNAMPTKVNVESRKRPKVAHSTSSGSISIEKNKHIASSSSKGGRRSRPLAEKLRPKTLQHIVRMSQSQLGRITYSFIDWT